MNATPTEQQIRMAARIYEMRDAAKTILGERYQARMAELGGVIKQIAASQSVDVLQAALLITKQPGTPAVIVMQVFAAAAELVEPSVQAPAG